MIRMFKWLLARAQLKSDPTPEPDSRLNWALITALPDLIVRMRRDGTYLDYHCGEEFTLFDAEAMRVGRSIFEVLPVEAARERLCYIEAAFATGKSQTYEYQLVMQGGIRYEEARIVPYSDREVLVIVRNITRRVEAETILRQSQTDLLEAQRLARMGSWDFNLQTGKITWSEEMLRMLGCSPDQPELDYPGLLELLPSEDRQQLDDLVNQTITKGVPYIYEHRLRRMDGSVIWLLCRGEALRDEQGKTLKILGTSVDITERKQIELELQQAKEAAEAANQAKSQFLANMSHELRTPFTIILGYAQLLEQDESLNLDQHQSLRAIRSSGEHLLGLINSILDLSKAESGQMQPQETALVLTDLIDGLQKMFHDQASRKGLAIQFSIANVPQSILTDASKLRQILINLLHNAIKFTDQGGIRLSITQAEGDLVFQVKDSGVGIPPAERELIFAAFSQTQAGRSVGGTGLGLTISRKFAQILGGKLTVESQIGQGSSFTLRLPVQTVCRVSEPKAPLAAWPESAPVEFGPAALCRMLPLVQADLYRLSPDWRQSLYEAALQCNDRALRQLIQQIPVTYADLATDLERLVYDYQFEIILQLSQPSQ